MCGHVDIHDVNFQMGLSLLIIGNREALSKVQRDGKFNWQRNNYCRLPLDW